MTSPRLSQRRVLHGAISPCAKASLSPPWASMDHGICATLPWVPWLDTGKAPAWHGVAWGNYKGRKTPASRILYTLTVLCSGLHLCISKGQQKQWTSTFVCLAMRTALCLEDLNMSPTPLLIKPGHIKSIGRSVWCSSVHTHPVSDKYRAPDVACALLSLSLGKA